MMPLLNLMGYDISVATAEIINNKSYAISHRASNLEGFPVHIVGVNQSLDKRAESGGARLSPHALAQEYLNNHEHLYSLVTNGKYLRLLRDATLLSRLSFVEFNLEQIMEENLYAEFALLFRLLHASRMPQKIENGPESILEFYHVEALASGSRIRERLSKAVEISIRDLANGLLAHPANKDLREAVLDQKISAKDFYLYNLRIIYRLLFLLVIEDRKLIYPEKTNDELSKKKDFYYKFYSLQRLTNLAENLIYVDPKKTDLWSSLLTTFSLFEYKDYGEKLGIAPLGSGIFHPNALGLIRNQLLDNENLLSVLRYLVSFENENYQRVRVNYADLDVEEFGSVYEGLLEYEPIFEENLGLPVFTFVQGDERSSSGSHYTPEELVKPLIDHSLQYQIEEKLKESDPEKGLLSLTVCDVACGSGHILLSAARRIGFELAKVRSGEDQPTPTLLRIAVRDVIRNCIYGVDLNPLAVELCKVALWLEAHQPGEPLNFLDHHIKCGNAIVGLAHFEELKNGIATEAFKTLPGDDSEVAATFRRANEDQRKKKGQLSLHDLDKVEANIKEIQNDFIAFLSMPEHTPQQIEAKTKAYESLTSGKKWFRIKQLADLQVAQFFIPKTAENREKLTTEATYQNYLNSGAQIQDRGAAMAISAEKRFFHWFLEFPQVFSKGGFDCILGNPPYLGDKKLKSNYGESFLNLVLFYFRPIGAVDLSGYFLRRIYELINNQAFLSIITTNSISQGNTRKGGLEYLLKKSGHINHAVSSMKWPGKAAVEISLLTVTKIDWKKSYYLNGKIVTTISALLDDSEIINSPVFLNSNKNKSFIGSYVLGSGFVLDLSIAEKLIRSDSNNKEIIFPFLNGYDLNNDPKYQPSRFVINFFDWPETRYSANEWKELKPFDKKSILDKIKEHKFIPKAPPNYVGKVATDYPLCYNIIKELVKPERQRWKLDSKGNELIGQYAVRDPMPERWWIYGEKRPGLYGQLKKFSRTLTVALTSKTVGFVFLPTNIVFSHATVVIPSEKEYDFAILQSSIHRLWVDKYSSRMKTDQRYTPSGCYENFPFPIIRNETANNLEQLGKEYYGLRDSILLKNQIGLTKLYNLTNDPNYQEVDELRILIKKLDEVVLEAYGWKEIQLCHDFYEFDYLPDNDRVRYTIHPDARKEVLKRLLSLNHKRFEEEAAQGLHKRKNIEAYFKEKGEEIPEEIAVQFPEGKDKPSKKKSSPKSNKVEEPSSNYKMDFENGTVVSENCKVQIKNGTAREYLYHVTPKAVKDEFTGEFKQINPSTTLAKSMLGKRVGERFEFGELEYEIIEII
ncbi:Eco57I restriction-modification methylase domain-containing protein [Gillisia sp. Q332]|uniref:Eco57I restriction-modification methylase domain-containing protein n=1 Tax=Gillisia xinjiangensis TaxID=3384765 RepID=UPI0039198CD4